MTSGLRVNVVGAWCLALLLMGAILAPETPLADAAMRGDVEMVRSLLEGGADLDAPQGDGMTALHWAAERGDREIAKLLISAGADMEAGTRLGGYTPLHLASKGGHSAVAAALLEAGGEANALTGSSAATPLHLAAAAADGEAVVSLLLSHGADVNAREASAGQTPLMFAAGYNRAASIRTLLKGGADPAPTTEVINVLERVAVDRLAARRLKETISDFRGDELEEAEWEPTPGQVQAAIRAQWEVLNDSEAVKPAAEGDSRQYGVDTELVVPSRPEEERSGGIRETLVRYTGGLTALLHAAREGHIEAALSLLDAGADVNQVSASDATSPLLMATLNGHFDLALLLIERGADPTLAASTDGATPLFAVLQTQWAPKSRYPQPRAHDLQKAEYREVMEALLEAGADTDVQLKTHLWYWEYGRTRIGLDIKGATPFWRATIAQDVEAMRLLVAYGADPNIPTSLPPVNMREGRQQDGRLQDDSGLPSVTENQPGYYPIHVAAGGGYVGLGAHSIRHVPDGFMSTVKYLVEEHGADVNIADFWGYTPVHYAAIRGDNELILYLVSQGADVTTKTRLGQTTADMARGGRGGYFQRVEFPETLELLQSLGSELACLHTHFGGTGDVCEGAGAADSFTPAVTDDATDDTTLPR